MGLTQLLQILKKLNTLSDYSHLLLQARDTNFITEAQQETLENWRKDPANWG